MASTRFRLALWATICIVAGCAQETSVSGTVTFNGQPIERGSIRFVSTEKQGPTFGAVIKNGKYTVEKAVPGPKVATIQAMNERAVPTSSAELEQLAEQAQTTGKAVSDTLDPLALIPPDAEGNSQTVEIHQGPQTLDFHLKSRQR
jgi:hypothetical protein